MAKTKLAVLISGRGSNLKSLLSACENGDFPAEISLVISNRPKAAGLEIAADAGVATKIINHKSFGPGDEGRPAFDAALCDALETVEADYVCLAGFMRLLTGDFVTKWRGRLINIHPSLLPAFKGLNVHERMIDAGVKIAGCTVHFVTHEMDAGPIIGQTAVPVLPNDDAAALAARILAEEHKLYPQCIRMLAEKKARITSTGIVAFSEGVQSGTACANPLSQ